MKIEMNLDKIKDFVNNELAGLLVEKYNRYYYRDVCPSNGY